MVRDTSWLKTGFLILTKEKRNFRGEITGWVEPSLHHMPRKMMKRYLYLYQLYLVTSLCFGRTTPSREKWICCCRFIHVSVLNQIFLWFVCCYVFLQEKRAAQSNEARTPPKSSPAPVKSDDYAGSTDVDSGMLSVFQSG